MLNNFEENLIINEKDIPRNINVFVENFERTDVIQLNTELQLIKTSKDGASIKFDKSIDFEDISRSNNQLKITSQIKC